MVAMASAKSLHSIPTWTRSVALVSDPSRFAMPSAATLRAAMPASSRSGGSNGGNHESNTSRRCFDVIRERGFKPETCALDKGYDMGRVYEECEDRACRSIIPLRETPAVKAGRRPAGRPATAFTLLMH